MQNARSTRCLVSLGANLGNAKQTILNAADVMAHRFGSQSIRFSQLYRTSAVGGPRGQEDFYNAVATIDSDLTAFEVWQFLHSTEQQLGRKRLKRWEARRIDLDVLLHQTFFDSRTNLVPEIIWTPTFKVPHPRMTMRTFVLTPACDIAKEWIEPVTGQSLHELSQRLNKLAQANRSPVLFITCDDVATIESLLNALRRIATVSTDIENGTFVLKRQGDTWQGDPWIVACPLQSLAFSQMSSGDVSSQVLPIAHRSIHKNPFRESIASSLAGLPAIHFDHWLHVCRSPDPSISHWEDFCRPWAEFFKMSRGHSAIHHDFTSLGFDALAKTPPYLLAADDLHWAAHEIVAATDAMTCPIHSCGSI